MQLGFASELAALSAVARPRIPFLILNCALLNFNHLKSDIVVTFTNRVGAASEARIVLRQWITLTILTICGAALAQFKFNECRQLFIRVHNETLSVAAVHVGNPDRSPVGIRRLLMSFFGGD